MSSVGSKPGPEQSWLKSGALFADPEKRTLVLSLTLFSLTLLVYYPVSKNAFINFDDQTYILANSHVRAGLHWTTVQWAFTTFYASNWHPLTWLSHALDCELFGLNPAGHHFVNLLLHDASAVLLFLAFKNMTGFTWRSLMVAGLFAIHPLSVESVSWAAERKNVLSMLFFLMALCAYITYVRKPGVARYLSVIGLFALGLMSKPQIVTFPLVLLLLDYWPLNRIPHGRPIAREGETIRLLAEKIPLLVLSAMSCLITLVAQRSGHAVRTVAESPLPLRLENAIVAYVRYIGQIFFPWRLAPMYPYPAGPIGMWRLITSAAALLAITALVVRYRKFGFLPVGWLWFLGTLVPMIGLVQVGEQAMADRYAYLPMIGICLMVVWATREASRKWENSRWVLAVASGITLAALSLVTSRQIGYWRNSETLWKYTLRVTDRNYMAEDNLAQELAVQGRVDEALVHFRAAENLHNYDPGQVLALGIYVQRNGHPAAAITQYNRVLQTTADPRFRTAAFANAGFANLDLKDDDHARQCFESALRLDPNNATALVGSGLIAFKSGDMELAIRQYTKAVSIHPDDFGYMLLARALERSGRASDAEAAYQHAERLTTNIEATRSLVDRSLAR